MAAVRDQSDTDNWLSRCTIASLLPRTLGSSSSSHAAVSELEDADFVGNLLKSTAMKDSTQLLEQAKTIINSSCSSIPDGSFDWKDVLSKRAHEVQVELKGKRNRQRRPGLAGLERAKQAFNFSAKTTTASSQMLTSELFKGAAEAKAPAAESWPVIDYSCLKNISDPVEYFSTYRMLENAEKEVKRLKGELSLKPSQPHGKRDRQRRPGLSNLEGRKTVFRFPEVASSVKRNSLVEKPSLSEYSNVTEVAVTSPFKESKIDKKADEFEQLLSACRDVDDDIGIANRIREILQLNPIYMGKIGVPRSPSARENLLQNCQLGQISPGTTRNNVNLLPILKRRVSLINSQGDVFLPPNGNDQISGSCRNSDVVENLRGHGTGDQNDDFEKVVSNNIDMMPTSSMEGSLNNSLFCPEKTAIEPDLLSSLQPMSLINIGARLDEISTLKRRIASQNTNDIQPVVFTHDNSGDHTLSKSQEPNFLSTLKGIHVDGSMVVDNVFNEVMPNGRKLCFEGKVNSPIAGTFVVDRSTSKSVVADVPKQCPHSLLDDVGGRMDGGLGEKEFVSIVTSAGFEKASQALVSVDHGVSNCLVNNSSDTLLQHFGSSGTTADLPVELLQTEAPKDDHLPEESTLMGEHVATSHNILDASNGNHGNVVEFGRSRGRNPKRKAPVRKQTKRESISRRKSLAGAGTVIEHGVRRSTRIKTKPLQYWCGERFLYGRVHDSLATVIGVKMLATPGKDGRSVMKVKSYVSEQYADLVAQAALH